MSYVGHYVFQATSCQVKRYDPGMSKRRYEQRLRAEAAAETRQRILDALYDRLRDAPADPISVDEVARIARVARSTVYLVFGSRSGLFDALTESLLQGAGYDRILEAVRHPDARETLRGGIEGGVHMYAAHRDVLRVLNSMAKLDPEGVGQALAGSERQRAAGMAWLAGRLDEQGHLRPGVTADHAAHVIWILAGFEAYDSLAAGRGLPEQAIADILVDTAEHALLAGDSSKAGR
jgi:AcrR family transcriptional regulator